MEELAKLLGMITDVNANKDGKEEIVLIRNTVTGTSVLVKVPVFLFRMASNVLRMQLSMVLVHQYLSNQKTFQTHPILQ